MFSINSHFGSPDTSKELRTDRPFKTVHMEYYLLDGWGLIGNVGGTLGLFTGFSFFGFLTWAYELAKKAFTNTTNAAFISK